VSRRSSAEATVSPRVTPLRERFRRESLAAIADAAEQVFAEDGVRDAHVGHIAKRAGVAVGTLYNYYEDRDALLAALIRERKAQLLEALDAAMEAARGAPVRAEVRAFVAAFFEFFVTHRRFFKILLEGELSHLQTSYPTAAAIPSEVHRALLARLEGIFDRGVSAGTLRGDRADLYPWLLLGMSKGVMMRDLRKYKAYDPNDAEALVDVFLRGAET
jgi:AcrR family transcriptional regulator